MYSVFQSPKIFHLYTRVNASGGGGSEFTYRDPKDNKIIKKPLLFLQDTSSLKFKYEHEFAYPLEEALAKTGNTGKKILNLINQVSGVGDLFSDKLNNASRDSFVPDGNSDTVQSKTNTPVYRELPSWTKTSNIEFPSTLTFVFRFGYMGEYSGRTEVYDPIRFLASHFAPSESHHPKSPGSLYNLPLPLSGVMLASVVKNMVKGAKDPSDEQDAEGGFKDTQEEDSGILDGAFQKVSGMVETFNKSVVNTYISGRFSAICRAQMGNLIIPAFVVKGCQWDFDFSNVDSEGYPIAGTLTLTGCESLEVANKGLIGKMMA